MHAGGEEFWQLLYTAITSMWEASGCATFPDAFAKNIKRISVLHTLEILRRCDATTVKVPPDLHLSLLLEAADVQNASDLKSNCQQLTEKIRQLVPLCTETGLSTAAEKLASFDVFVSSRELLRELMRRSGLKRKAYHRQCSQCLNVFANEEEAARVKCWKTVIRHSQETFVSKAGNVCCQRCNQPLSSTSYRCSERVDLTGHTLSLWLEK